MDNETKGQLIAWEAIAREAYTALTPEQRAKVMTEVNALLERQPGDIRAGTMHVKFEITRIR